MGHFQLASKLKARTEILRYAQNETIARLVILNPSSVILSEAKDLFLLRVNFVKDLS